MGGDIQLPDVEGPALVGLHLLVLLGGVLFLQDVAGSGVSGDDAGTSLELDPLTVVEDFSGSGRGNEDEGAAKDKDKGREWLHGVGLPGKLGTVGLPPSVWADPGVELLAHGLRASRGLGCRGAAIAG